MGCSACYRLRTSRSACARYRRIMLVLSAVALSLGGPAAGQTRSLPDTVVVPGISYGAGSLRRFLMGAHYRDLWTTPIRVEMLDLQRFAGGLTPVRAHAGSQTTSLRFHGADGRTYQFRSVFKTPTARLPQSLSVSLHLR